MTESARDPISALVLCVPVLYRAHRALEEYGGFLARHFVRHAGILQIPEGEPNHEELDPDKERRSRNWDEEEDAGEPMAGKRTRRGQLGVRRQVSRRVPVSEDDILF
jgi:hypothetical protein